MFHSIPFEKNCKVETSLLTDGNDDGRGRHELPLIVQRPNTIGLDKQYTFRRSTLCLSGLLVLGSCVQTCLHGVDGLSGRCIRMGSLWGRVKV